MSSEQIEKRNMVRRSAFIAEDMKKGTSIRKLKIEFRRPGNGISPDEFEKLPNLVLKKDLFNNHKLTLTDLI